MTDAVELGGRRHLAGLCLGVAWMATFAGCATAPAPRTLVIVPSLPQPAHEAPEGSAVNPAEVVSLAPIQVPEHWQRRSVVHLQGDAELVAWPDAVWAERVEAGLTRRLSQALRQRAPALGWWTAEGRATPRRLLIDVSQLDVHAGRGQLVAVLQWRLVDRQGRVLGAGRWRQTMSLAIGSAQEEASALGQWLDAQAEQIVAQVQALPAVSDTADTTNGRR